MVKEKLENVKDSDLTLEELSRPVMKYLKEHYHPHVTCIVTSNNMVLTEMLMGFSSDDKE